MKCTHVIICSEEGLMNMGENVQVANEMFFAIKIIATADIWFS